MEYHGPWAGLARRGGGARVAASMESPRARSGGAAARPRRFFGGHDTAANRNGRIYFGRCRSIVPRYGRARYGIVRYGIALRRREEVVECAISFLRCFLGEVV